MRCTFNGHERESKCEAKIDGEWKTYHYAKREKGKFLGKNFVYLGSSRELRINGVIQEIEQFTYYFGVNMNKV